MNRTQITLMLIIFLEIISIILITINIFSSTIQQSFNIFTSENIKCPPDCNIIIISIDTLRADHLSSYGYFRNTTPNIDQFAKKSILFENVFTQADWTIASYVSLFTSKYSMKHGVDDWNKKIKDSDELLAEILKKNGYVTAGFAEDDGVKPIFGFGRGFDEYYFNYPMNNTKIPEWLMKNKNKKIFLFLQYDKVHLSPDINDNPVFDASPKENLWLNESFWDEYINYINCSANSNKESTENISYSCFMGPNFIEKENFYWMKLNNKTKPIENVTLNENQLNHLIALYDGNILDVDSEIKFLFNQIQEFLDLKKTIIIISADHGHQFLEHGKFNYGAYLYDEVTHVPLLIHIPNSRLKGIRINNQVQLIDIMPTILDMLNIPIPKEVQGKSLIPLIEGKAEKDFNKYIYLESFSKITAVRTPDWKLIKHPDERLEMYDLKKDPKELINVADKYPDAVKELKNKLDEWLIVNQFGI